MPNAYVSFIFTVFKHDFVPMHWIVIIESCILPCCPNSITMSAVPKAMHAIVKVLSELT